MAVLSDSEILQILSRLQRILNFPIRAIIYKDNDEWRKKNNRVGNPPSNAYFAGQTLSIIKEANFGQTSAGIFGAPSALMERIESESHALFLVAHEMGHMVVHPFHLFQGNATRLVHRKRFGKPFTPSVPDLVPFENENAHSDLVVNTFMAINEAINDEFGKNSFLNGMYKSYGALHMHVDPSKMTDSDIRSQLGLRRFTGLLTLVALYATDKNRLNSVIEFNSSMRTYWNTILPSLMDRNLSLTNLEKWYDVDADGLDHIWKYLRGK